MEQKDILKFEKTRKSLRDIMKFIPPRKWIFTIPILRMKKRFGVRAARWIWEPLVLKIIEKK